jgi:hypothetical protein
MFVAASTRARPPTSIASGRSRRLDLGTQEIVHDRTGRDRQPKVAQLVTKDMAGERFFLTGGDVYKLLIIVRVDDLLEIVRSLCIVRKRAVSRSRDRDAP